ncbi:MAG: GAF domain-containing sensor histidine kinase, partial [Chloroflexi bacterium]|nr:GAF domain-containing sensor histidine kinase [Chloroflexota bacterium]
APLKLNDEVFGLLSLFCFEPNAYTKDDEDFVELVADQIAGTVANAQLYARLRDAEELQTHLAEESAIMAEVGRVVSSSLEFNDVYERFAELVRFLVPFDRIAISLVDLDLGRATVAYSAGMAHPVHSSGKAPIEFGSVEGEVARSRKGMLVQGEDWTGQSGVLKEGSTTFRSVITVPLIADTSVIGLMFVSSVEDDAYTLRDLVVVQRVGDQIAGVLAIMQLYTQRSETENLLRASASQVRQQAAELSYINSDLVKANQTKSEFLSNMSHELRTPLNAVLGFADLLTEPVFGSLSERQSRFVENITTAGNQLLRLINDTLELSKIQDGLLKLMVEEVNVETCLDYCVKSIRNKRSDVTVSMQVDMPEGRVFYGDKRRLTQIVLCLLENAVKFSPADSHVELRASTSDDALHISVTDRGMGIHERYHKRIFDLFDQGHPDVGRKYGGSGLGLALVKHLVELHEGHVDVESSEGRGSVFTVRLPFRHNVKTDEAAPPATVWSGPVDMADAWSIC